MYKIDKNKSINAKHSFITRDKALLDKVNGQYNRSDKRTCVKVFYANPLEEGQGLRDAKWGDDPRKGQPRLNTNLYNATRIQNICWWYGLAPRVYGLFEAEYEGKRVVCQLTDFLEGKPAKVMNDVNTLLRSVKDLGYKFCFGLEKEIFNCNDVIGGKMVDLQPFDFDEKEYKEKIKEIYIESGKYGKVYYQDVPELGLSGGPRKSKKREDYLGLSGIDFKDKLIWDIGCAGGYFCRYAMDHGAIRAVGVDFKEPIEAAFQIGNFLGHFNIDYHACDIRKGLPKQVTKDVADVAFFLSMNYHIEVPKEVLDARVLIFEDNGRESRRKDTLGSPWTDHFDSVELVGRAKDHGDKPCYILRKN